MTPAAGFDYSLPFSVRDAISVETTVGDVHQRRDALRLAIRDEIVPFVIRCKPDVVFIEDPQSQGVGLAKKLCTVRVMIEEALFALTGEVPGIVHPSTWRSHVNRLHAKRTPDDLKSVASRVLGMSKKQQDMADAVWIAAAGLYRINGESWEVGP